MKKPTLLSHARSLNPGHFLFYSVNRQAPADKQVVTPIAVRDEPLRGMNASDATKEAEKTKAVLQVVESAALNPGDDTLIIRGKVSVTNAIQGVHACNEAEYFAVHRQVMAEAEKDGVFSELSNRYALNLACGNWGWRNATESESVTVEVSWKNGEKLHTVTFPDLMLAETDPFNFDHSDYAAYRDDLVKLSAAIEAALKTSKKRATRFAVQAELAMGLGARVYPSQEWASEDFKKASLANWKGGKGITRILAKMKLPDGGGYQAFMNDRKVGNMLRVVDTWYPGATGETPIAVEPYGANSHRNVALRASGKTHIFGLIGALCTGESLNNAELSFYVACCIRGGVFSSTD